MLLELFTFLRTTMTVDSMYALNEDRLTAACQAPQEFEHIYIEDEDATTASLLSLQNFFLLYRVGLLA